RVVDDALGGLNAALRRGAAEAVRLAPGDAVGALQADLPALRPAELDRVLTAAGEFEQSFLADAAEVGTTFYGTLPGTPFTPGFGGESRARHLGRGAKEITLDGVPSVRRDVDTPADLEAALALGVGPRTAAVAARILADGSLPGSTRAGPGGGRAGGGWRLRSADPRGAGVPGRRCAAAVRRGGRRRGAAAAAGAG